MLKRGEVISVAFAFDCDDRQVPAFVESRPLTGADICTLMDRALRARVGEATFKAWYAGHWLSDNGPQYRAPATILWLYLTGVVLIITPVYNQESNGCPGHKPHSDFQGRRACPLRIRNPKSKWKVRVGTTKKSTATMSPICAARKVRHGVEGRGERRRMYLAMVRPATA